MLSAENVKVTIGSTQILHGLDFSAQHSAVTAIVGPNGSGKTTLLKALTGDIEASGTYRLNGCDPAQLKPWELAAMRGVLPQASVLAFPFTVVEVVRIGLRSGTSGDHAQVVMAALAKVGLASYANRFYQELSGGEQQRVQLARVLAQVWHPVERGEPRWLFLDEPVASLDIAHQLEVMNIARDFATAGGGVVAVMHDLNLTAMFADSVAILSQGRLLQQGPPAKVMTNETLSLAYGCTLQVNTEPSETDARFLLPHAASLNDIVPAKSA